MEDVDKTIGDVSILEGISFELKKGTITALLGPNGAGKTTTIRIILGLLKPTNGKVTVLGNSNNNLKKNRGRIGLLPQINSGYNSLTGMQNITFIMELYGKNSLDYEQELALLLDRLDLKKIVDKPWSVLSGGEKRALAFIRAILSAEELLLLDEPTTGLDLARAAIIRKIIQEQVEKGKTVLMSSHVLTDLEELAKKIVIIKNGRITKSGTPEEIQNHFAKGGTLEEAIVASFLNNQVDN